MAASSTLDGHLGEGTQVRGTLRFEGSVRIDGAFNGKIFSPATLILGPEAEVEGELQVGKLAVHGSLRGKVKATEQITIHEQGRVEADLYTEKLEIETGAYFNGTCEMSGEGSEDSAGGSEPPGTGKRHESDAGAGTSSAPAAPTEDRESVPELPGVSGAGNDQAQTPPETRK